MYVLIVLLCIVSLLFYCYVKKKYMHWKLMGVVQSEPTFFIGNLKNMLFKTKSQGENVQDIYNQFPNSRYVGAYQFLEPTLMLRDPELIKQITIKDFDHFTDHRIFTEEANKSGLWSQNVFSLKGDKWKEMRATISPAFTTSKMRLLFVLINECSENFTKYFLKKTKNTISVELKDIFERYTNDVTAITTFGVSCDSLADPSNDFYSILSKAADMPVGFKVFFYGIFQKLAQFFSFSIAPPETTNFFRNLVQKAIDIRERHNIIRPDLIHILLQAKKGELKNEDQNYTDVLGNKSDFYEKYKKKYAITNDDIIAQCLVFHFAGIDTTSRLISYTGYELALNPDIQAKVREEIQCALDENNGELSYDGVMKMKYLDTVLLEALRKYPPTVNIDRNCIKAYTIPPENASEKPVHLKPNHVIWIPVFAIQRDAKYFPEPEKFDPDRFNEENKKLMKPFSFLPFGAGPRSCIGDRFAMLEAKTLFVHLLRNFEIIVVEKTKIPLTFGKEVINLDSEGGIYVGFKPINN